MFSVYFLKSERNGKVYVGMTEYLPEERLSQHNSGTNVFTRENRPWKLMYYEKYHCKIDAHERERFYKTGIGRKVRNAIIECMGA